MYSDYGLTNPSGAEGLFAGASVVAVVFVILLILVVVAVVVLMLVANCKLFKKAGEEWWKALVPLYNSWIETKITGLAWWWFIIFVVITALATETEEPNFVLYMGIILTSFNYNFNLAKKFGKTNGFAVLNTLLPIIGLPILAFGSATYDKNATVDENGIFSLKK